MSDAVPANWFRPGPTSLLGRLLGRRARHPDEFDAAVRVVSGAVDGESVRWRYRRSAADPLVRDGVVTVVHGTVTLRLRFAAEPLPRHSGLRPQHRAWRATEVVTGAQVELATDVVGAGQLGLA